MTLTETIKVTLDKDIRGGNKTLIGVGANSGLTGAGLDLSYADNIIVRNLKIAKASGGEGDAITIQASHHIWIDHCDLSSDRNDTDVGLRRPGRHHARLPVHHRVVDAVPRSQGHQPGRPHSPIDATGRGSGADASPTITTCSCDVDSGPRVRWGIAHVFNNHFQDVTVFGVVSESEATVRSSTTCSTASTLPIATTYLGRRPAR